MNDHLDLDRYPLDQVGSPELSRLEAACRRDLDSKGMLNLEGFVRAAAVARMARELQMLGAWHSYEYRHTVYLEEPVGAPPHHAALTHLDTAYHSLCADQLRETLVHALYEWAPLPAFLARVLHKPRLFVMADPLARVNVIEFRPGQTLNWHFDLSFFTTTIHIQTAEQGGRFEYRSDLRTASDPNHEGVAALLRGADPDVRVNPLPAGTLNVLTGKNTLHRVSPVQGQRSRLMGVYFYHETPDVMLSAAERRDAYGRDQ